MRGRTSTFVAVVAGGAVAGLVDLGAASAINGFIDPLRVARFISAGLLGLRAAKAMGMQSALLGVALQVGMGIAIAAIYAVGARFVPRLRRHWLPAGLAFGVGVFVVMNYIVVPLSALHGTPTFTAMSFALNMAAMLVFGTIIAWFARE
jgi:hypothetical protein